MNKSTAYAIMYTVAMAAIFAFLMLPYTSNKITRRPQLQDSISTLNTEITHLKNHVRYLHSNVFDTVIIGIPIAQPKEYELHQHGVWYTDEFGGDLTMAKEIWLIHGELFVEHDVFELHPFSQYYVSEIEQAEALLEIIRTRTFEYDGETLDSSYVIINEPK